MIVEFRDNNFFENLKDIFIRQGSKTLKIFYGGNLDLYFDVFDHNRKLKPGFNTITFCIEQNSEIYNIFDNLLNDILNCNVYDENESEFNISNKKLKDNSKLVHGNTIEWYSDSIYDEKANLLKLEKTEEGIVFTFNENPNDPTFGFEIRICNSGSKYDPFNLCFMKLYDQFQNMAKSNSKLLSKQMNK